MCGTTGRVVVYKPKVQSGGQRFTQSVTETMVLISFIIIIIIIVWFVLICIIKALVVKYKHTYQAAKKRVDASKGKAEDPLAEVNSQLESLIEISFFPSFLLSIFIFFFPWSLLH